MGVAAKLSLVTRHDCHLCDEMARVLTDVLPQHGLTFDVVDVDEDPDLLRKFGETVPVLLRDGRPVAKVRLEPDQLRRIIRRRR